jgi:predicted RNA-binding Zn-ribbon protein involved in translation (DUF1610 family)
MTSKSPQECFVYLTLPGETSAVTAGSVIDTFGTAVMRHESGAPDQCPQCGSYALDIGFDPELMPRPYILECENCGWQKQQEEEA